MIAQLRMITKYCSKSAFPRYRVSVREYVHIISASVLISHDTSLTAHSSTHSMFEAVSQYSSP